MLNPSVPLSLKFTQQEYVKKAETMLKDGSTYVELKLDPTSGIQRKSNDFVKQFFERNWIDLPLKKYVSRYDSIPPKFYGLPKVHKQGFPLRPVSTSICRNSRRRFSKISEMIT